MGIMAKHIQQDKRTGRLMYRRAFPADLRSYIPGNLRELKRSLGSTSLDARAKIISAEAEQEFDRIVQVAKRRAANTSRTLAIGDIAFLVQTYAHRLRQNLADTHFDQNDGRRTWMVESGWRYAPIAIMDAVGSELAGRDHPWTNSERIREKLPELLRTWRLMIADGLRSKIVEAEGQAAEHLLSEFALHCTDADDALFFELCCSLLRADIAAGEQLLGLATDGIEIEPVEAPELTTAIAHSQVTQRKSSDSRAATMQSLAEVLMRNKADPIGRPTQESWRTALRQWSETYGDLQADNITRRIVSEWLDLLAQRPTGLPRKLEQVPLPELVARYATDKQVRRLSGKTVRQHLGSLSAIWNKAERKGLLGEVVANPFANHEVRVEVKGGGNPLTVDELNAIFSLPVFASGERPTKGRGEAAYWIPLLLLFTGARPGEVAQLIVSDFEQDDGGKWLMRYSDDGEHPAIGRRSLKTSRHGTGSRVFPVPQTLLDLGIVRYIDWLKGRGEVALFPKLTNTTKGLHEHWARWWGPYLREHGAIAPDKRQSREFRHNFTTALRDGGVSDEAISYLVGHSLKSGGTTRRYGDRSPYGREIEKLKFHGLDLSQVKVWAEPL